MLTEKVRQQEQDMKDLFTKIAEMKQVKTIIEEELIEARSREEYYRNFYAEKEKMIETLTIKAE